ncbi:MAG: HPP family protein [Deltaproteobacteria bacterium]|jgi:CBS-domain-containing membrane protein|nr:HPP family protein [Deltaproteobacteria bacterium]
MHIRRKRPEDVWRRAMLVRGMLRDAAPRLPSQKQARRKTATRARAYFAKMRGSPSESLGISPVEITWSFIGSLIGMGLLSWCNLELFSRTDNLLLLGTFGASAMLLFGAPQAAFAQPRNVIGGHVVSALVGIAVVTLCGDIPHLTPAIAVAGAIAAMHATGTLHPPGGGTALIMATGSPVVEEFGYLAVFFPVATGAGILVAVALVVNNFARDRRYPVHWW